MTMTLTKAPLPTTDLQLDCRALFEAHLMRDTDFYDSAFSDACLLAGDMRATDADLEVLTHLIIISNTLDRRELHRDLIIIRDLTTTFRD